MSVKRISACGILCSKQGQGENPPEGHNPPPGLQPSKRKGGYHNGKNTTIRKNKQGKFILLPYLMYKVKGVTSGVYIPVDLEEEVKEWSREYKRVKATIQEICRAQKSIIRRYVKEKRLKKGRK